MFTAKTNNRFTKLLLCVLVLSVSIDLRAQNYYEDERVFYGGLVAGGNFCQVDGDNFAGYHKAGFNLGGIVYTKLDEHVAASMEVLYVQKGSKAKGTFTIANGYYIVDYGITLNYAEVPIILNYFDKHKHHFGIGASYSRLGTSKEFITTYPTANTVDLNAFPFRKSDYNLLLSGNLHCWKGFYLNMRFQYSMISIRNNTPQNYARGQQFNNVYAIRLMYLFM